MIVALLLALPASSLVPGAGVTLPAWASGLGLKTDRTPIARRVRLARGLCVDPTTATLATLLPESPTCRLLTMPIGRPVSKAARAGWTKESDPRIAGTSYVRSAKGRFQRTGFGLNEQGRVAGMSDLYEDTTAVVRADFTRYQAAFRSRLGDPTDLDYDPRTPMLTLMWRWSSDGTVLWLIDEEGPKGAVLSISLSR